MQPASARLRGRQYAPNRPARASQRMYRDARRRPLAARAPITGAQSTNAANCRPSPLWGPDQLSELSWREKRPAPVVPLAELGDRRVPQHRVRLGRNGRFFGMFAPMEIGYGANFRAGKKATVTKPERSPIWPCAARQQLVNTALDDLWTPRHYGELSRRLRDVQQRGPRQRVGVVANMRGINPLQHDCARVVIYGDDSGRYAAK